MTKAARAGIVIASHGRTLLVESDDGDLVPCVARRTAGAPICGDRVDWLPQPHGPAAVIRVHDRATLLSRPDARGKPKLLCANVDQLLVVTALSPSAHDNGADHAATLKPDLIDSYLVAAEVCGLDAMIVVNKIDLADADRRAGLERVLAVYRRSGYRVRTASVKCGEGLDGLRAELRDHRSVLVGESGVGKSSLIDALVPGHDIRIGELSRAGGLGQHTTTVAMLFHLPDGGDLIDSPGVREFRLWPLTAGELAQGFREFRAHAGHCRFRDCRHLDDPGCALAEAAARGEISPARLDSYRRLLERGAQRA